MHRYAIAILIEVADGPIDVFYQHRDSEDEEPSGHEFFEVEGELVIGEFEEKLTESDHLKNEYLSLTIYRVADARAAALFESSTEWKRQTSTLTINFTTTELRGRRWYH